MKYSILFLALDREPYFVTPQTLMGELHYSCGVTVLKILELFILHQPQFNFVPYRSSRLLANILQLFSPSIHNYYSRISTAVNTFRRQYESHRK